MGAHKYALAECAMAGDVAEAAEGGKVTHFRVMANGAVAIDGDESANFDVASEHRARAQDGSFADPDVLADDCRWVDERQEAGAILDQFRADFRFETGLAEAAYIEDCGVGSCIGQSTDDGDRQVEVIECLWVVIEKTGNLPFCTAVRVLQSP